jgi:glucose-1-phosphate adenylyltransferase
MDYRTMLREHADSGADITLACIEVDVEDACRLGVVAVDAAGRVVRFDEKPDHPQALSGQPGRALASMGIYVFGREFLAGLLARDAANAGSTHDFGHDLLPWAVPRHRVMAHAFERSCVNMVGKQPYWRDVGTVDAYWEANIDLVGVVPALNLYDDGWPILSLQRQLPPAKFVFDDAWRRGMAVDALVSAGCIVSGAVVRRSLLCSKVRVGEGSVVEDAVLLPNVVVGRGVRLRRVVVDMCCVLPDGFSAGLDPEQDRQRFHVTERGITLITPEMLVQPLRAGH